MYLNRALPEIRNRLEAQSGQLGPGPAGAVGRSGQRTVEGAVVLTLLPVAIVLAASYLGPALVFLAGAIGTYLATSDRSNTGTPDTPPQRPRSVRTAQNRSPSSSE